MKLFRRDNFNALVLSVAVLLVTVQVLYALFVVLSWIQPGSGLADTLIPEWKAALRPSWDMGLYVCFVCLSFLLFGFALLWLRQRLTHKDLTIDLLQFTAVEAVLTFGMVSAAYKMMIYDNSPQLAQGVFVVFAIAAVLHKVFRPEIIKILQMLRGKMTVLNLPPWAFDVFCIVVIMAMIYLPNTERVVAMVFIGEALHHFDFLIMTPGWASLHGQLPYVGVISQYGVGIPVIFSKIIQMTGGFDYVQALNVMMWFAIIYFVLAYVFVRMWLKSAALAAIAFLLAFRLQMFHYGVSPIIWGVPSASPIRFGLDILWMITLLAHLRWGNPKWLIASSLYSGFAVFYMTSTGACVFASFYFYLAALFMLPGLREEWIKDKAQVQAYIISLILPIVTALGLFWMVLGGAVWGKTFWHNLIEYLYFFAHGHAGGVLPMFESLKYRYFWSFFMSIVMPLTYAATLIYITACLYYRKAPKEWLLVALICVYGLAGYQYYVVRSAVTSYYVGAVTFVFVACFWFDVWRQTLDGLWRRRITILAVVLSLYALVTNHNYLAYPNAFNFSHNPTVDNLVIQRWPDRTGYFNHQFKNIKPEDKLPINDLGATDEDMRTEDDFKTDGQLVDYYRRHFNFTQDAALIDSLTSAEEPVALLSSFETKILIQANRKTLFYHSPIITSRPMTIRNYPSDAAHSPDFLAHTLGELEAARPRYVFMEKVFLQDNLPASYKERNVTITTIAAYIRAHYEAATQGQYLVAMRRKD